MQQNYKITIQANICMQYEYNFGISFTLGIYTSRCISCHDDGHLYPLLSVIHKLATCV